MSDKFTHLDKKKTENTLPTKVLYSQNKQRKKNSIINEDDEQEEKPKKANNKKAQKDKKTIKVAKRKKQIDHSDDEEMIFTKNAFFDTDEEPIDVKPTKVNNKINLTKDTKSKSKLTSKKLTKIMEKNEKKKIANEMFDFIEGWTINIDKIPKYPEFSDSIFQEEVDRTILTLLLKDKSISNEQKLLLNRLINKIKHNIIYVKHEQLMKGNDVGRYYPEDNLSIISLCRKIKHTVFEYLGYTDFDMVSCHQSIALSIADMNNVELPAMSKYMFNKESIIQNEIDFYSVEGNEKVTIEDIKYKFNMMSYGGSEETWRNNIINGYDGNSAKVINNKESPFTQEFKRDINKIQKMIYENNDRLFKKIYTKHNNLTENEEHQKNKRTLLSCFFQIIENHVLFLAFKCLQKIKIIKDTTVCLEYDGLCIPTNKFDKEVVINNLNKNIVALTGLKFVKFKIKGYDCAINEIIEKRKSIDKESCYVSNDLDAAKKVYRLYPHWIYCNSELYVFDSNTGMWSTDTMVHFKVISEYEDFLYVANDKGSVSSTKSYGNTGMLAKKVIEMIKTLCIDNNWLRNNENSSLGKLLFNNGYYDMKEGTFYKKNVNGFDNYNILFFFKIDDDYVEPNEENKNYMKFIKETLFYTPLNKEVGNYLLLVFSRAIAGDRMKKIFFGLGSPNAGKSLVAKALSVAFCGYVGTFNAECLSNKNLSGDEAQQTRWAYLLRYVRLLFSNEVKMSITLNGASIKKHSSGGDNLVGRVHGGLETNFVPHYKLVVYANDIPEIVPYDDALEIRIDIFNYSKTFKENPDNEFEIKIKPELEENIKTLKFRRGLINLVIECYSNFIKNNKIIVPKEMEENKIEWVGEGSRNIIDKFIMEYTITNNENDYVLSSDIICWLKLSELGISFKKFFIELKKYAKVKNYNNVFSMSKKIDGKSENVWIGLKEK